jgi:hypothetical protein
MGKVLKGNNPNAVKIEVIEEIQRVSPKICSIDAKAD